jgi:hypothetical protein
MKRKKIKVIKYKLCKDCYTAHTGKREYCKTCINIYKLEELLSIYAFSLGLGVLVLMKRKKKKRPKYRLCPDCYTAHAGKREYCKPCMNIYRLEKILSMSESEYNEMLQLRKQYDKDYYKRTHQYFYPTT